jgi:SAM-dependent methyltransferase
MALRDDKKSNITEGSGRSPERLKEHYIIEKELASRLRNSNKHERAHLYSDLYDELFRRVPDHPQLTIKADSTKNKKVLPGLNLLRAFLNKESTYLEIGPGDCALAFEVAKIVKKVYAVDVSSEITKGLVCPDNFKLILSDGCSISVPSGSVDLAYSDQLMEHLHPEDAMEQLGNIYTALRPGGIYICVTPNRVSGPHDISMYFDDVATGFHMKEYTVFELAEIFRKAGFSKVKRFISFKGRTFVLPLFPADVMEKVLIGLPRITSRKLSKSLIFRLLLGGSDVKLIAIK